MFTALTLPLLITNVFAAETPKVLIPVFSECFRRQDDAAAWELLNNLLTTTLCALLGVWVLGATLSAIIVPIQIPGLEPATIAAAVRLSRLVFGLVLCQGLASILQSVLYARHRYVLCSSGKLLSNVLTISVVVLCHGRLGIEAVAAGMLVGNFVHVVVLGPQSNDVSEDSRNRSAVLDQGPRRSGGSRESLLAGSALPGSLKRLAADLKHQYRVTYARPQSLIPPERTTVSATRPGLTARGTLVKDRPQASTCCSIAGMF